MSKKEIEDFERPEHIEQPLDIPFKEFMPGQLIQSQQFNDDMRDIEDKVNEVVVEHNNLTETVYNHKENFLNPHQVNPHQIGTYEGEEIDGFVNDLKEGNFNDQCITNRVLGDGCVDTRVLADGAVTNAKTDPELGSQLNISKNMEIENRYTKQETDDLIYEKVGEGTYSKEEIDGKFEEYQAGTIVDGTIGVEKLKTDVGRKLDISLNPSITDRYTKKEVNSLIEQNGLPKDWGGLTEGSGGGSAPSSFGHIPVANVMVCGEFVTAESDILDIKVREVINARGDYQTLELRLDDSDMKLNSLATSVTDVESNVASFGTELDSISSYINNISDIFKDNLFGTNGYYKLPGGLIIQWGVAVDVKENIISHVSYSKPLTQVFCGVASMQGGHLNPQMGVTSIFENTKVQLGHTHTQTPLRNIGWIVIGI